MVENPGKRGKAGPPSLDDMLLFVEVARARSLSRAAETLEMPVGTVSRRITALERRLGVRLFERTTRAVSLTAAAVRYLERCGPIVDQARLAEESLREDASALNGCLRLSMPVDLGIFWIEPLITRFVRLHPQVSFDLDLSPQQVDLRRRQVDVAFRLGTVSDTSLVARPLGRVEVGLYAAPDYLARRGPPTAVDQLVAHDCLVLNSSVSSAHWRLSGPQGEAEAMVKGQLTVNNVGLLSRFAERGLGIAPLPVAQASLAVEAGALERVLPDFLCLPCLPLQAVVTSRLQPALVAAFIDHVAAHLGKLSAQRP